MALLQYFKNVVKAIQRRTSLIHKVPLTSISTEVAATYTAAGVKAVLGTYLEVNSEKKAKIGDGAWSTGDVSLIQ